VVVGATVVVVGATVVVVVSSARWSEAISACVDARAWIPPALAAVMAVA
jgi:hypothetical protein